MRLKVDSTAALRAAANALKLKLVANIDAATVARTGQLRASPAAMERKTPGGTVKIVVEPTGKRHGGNLRKEGGVILGGKIKRNAGVAAVLEATSREGRIGVGPGPLKSVTTKAAEAIRVELKTEGEFK